MKGNLTMSSIRRACMALLLLALLSACGGAPAAPAPTSAPATEPTAASAAQPTAAPTTDAAFPRTIKHSKGETTFEKPAMRVAALEWTYVEDLLAIGVQPIAVADIEGYNTWVKTPITLGPGAQDVGGRGEPNLEKLATAKPDLIIDTLENVSTNYDALVKIAPVLVFTPYSTDPSMNQYNEMTETLLKIAAATGRDAEGQAALDRMNATFAELAKKVEAAGQKDAPFILSQAWSDNGAASIRLFTDTAMASQIVERLGLKTAWKDSQGFQQYGFSTVSIEALPQISPDTNVFYVVQDSDNPFTMSAVKPLWDSLPFVKAGNAHALGGDTWLFGGPLSAEVLAGIVVNALDSGAAAPAATSATTAAGSAETRTVKHAMGESQVPLAPLRVVTLDMGELDAALALGIKPVGSVTIFEDGVFPAYLKGKTDGIEVVGTIASPNLEKILALKPDLILSSKTRDEERYDLLSKIAPTVFAERLGDAWLDNFSLFAEALGKQSEGAAIIAAYKQRLADLHSKLSANGPLPVVSMVRFIEGGQTRIYHAGSFIGTILAEGQFPRPASQQLTDKVWTESSKELIGDLDGDVIFYGVYGKPEDSPLTQFINDPLWKQLNAVKNQRVFQVADDYWYTSIG
jgi:iron complex transport system substrate-binding protein